MIDLLWWVKDENKKHQRLIGCTWCDLKKFKFLYEDIRKERSIESVRASDFSEGSKLTEYSDDSFDCEYQITNKERNHERKEMRLIKVFCKQIVK
jgi:hypothetical protein